MPPLTAPDRELYRLPLTHRSIHTTRLTFTVDAIDAEASIQVDNPAPLFPFDQVAFLERFFTVAKEIDADRIWDEDLGTPETFTHTLEQAVDYVVSPFHSIIREFSCPDAATENSGHVHVDSSAADLSWIEAAAVWVSQWLSLFHTELRYCPNNPPDEGIISLYGELIDTAFTLQQCDQFTEKVGTQLAAALDTASGADTPTEPDLYVEVTTDSN